MPKLENWYHTGALIVLAPEKGSGRLAGKVTGHPEFPDGEQIMTSTIVKITEDNKLITQSGSIYELGEPAEWYESLFPKAKERFYGNQTYSSRHKEDGGGTEESSNSSE